MNISCWSRGEGVIPTFSSQLSFISYCLCLLEEILNDIGVLYVVSILWEVIDLMLMVNV